MWKVESRTHITPQQENEYVKLSMLWIPWKVFGDLRSTYSQVGRLMTYDIKHDLKRSKKDTDFRISQMWTWILLWLLTTCTILSTLIYVLSF